MLCAEAGVEPIVLSAAAGRIRVHAVGFRHNDAWAAAIEETVATVTGVRAVQAYPRTESVVVWYAPEDCDTAAVLSAIAAVQDVPAPSSATRMSQSPVARGRSSVRSTIIGRLARTLLDPHRDAAEAPPEIERLRAALDHIGYHLPPATAGQASMVKQVGRNGRRIRWRWVLLALPLGLVAIRLTGFGLHSLTRWAVVLGPTAGRSRGLRIRRPTSPLAVMATGLAVPSWGGVAVALLLVTVAGAVSYRQRLGLTRELVIAAARAAVQLITAGALLRVLFQRPSLLGPAGWLLAMVLIAGQVAGRRGAGLPQAKVAATGGVAASTVGTLFVLLAA
jgi:hypothetical protein